VEVFENWDGHCVFRTAVGEQVRQKAVVLQSLGSLADLCNRASPLKDPLLIHSKPRAKVVTKKCCEVGRLVLVPESLNIKATELPVGEAMPKLEAGFGQDGTVEVRTSNPGKFQYTLAPMLSPKCMAPLWFVRQSADAEECNLEWAIYEVQSIHYADFRPGLLGARPAEPVPAKRCRKKTPKEGLLAEDDVVEGVVAIQVLINTVALDIGEELVVYRPPVPKKKRAVEAITYAAVEKKRAKSSD